MCLPVKYEHLIKQRRQQSAKGKKGNKQVLKKANDFVTLLSKLLSKMCLKKLVFSLPLPSANVRTVLQREHTPSTKKGKRDDSLTTLTRNEQ